MNHSDLVQKFCDRCGLLATYLKKVLAKSKFAPNCPACARPMQDYTPATESKQEPVKA
jgi:hypothetical protein